MARYIDADLIPYVESEDGVLDDFAYRYDINEIPTTDVVPKSEVDRLIDKWIGEEKLTQDEKTLRLIEALRDEAKRYERYYFNHEYDKLISEAKTEVAREIFEEIEKCSEVALMNGHIDTPILCIGFGVLAELKKKYTEEKESNNDT